MGLLISFMMAMLCLSLSALSFASENTKIEADPVSVNVHVQNFSIDDPENVVIQLRYVDKKIKYFALQNNGKQSVKVTLFEVSHLLEPHQDLTIPVPDSKYVVVDIAKYDSNIANSAKAIYPSKIYLFKRQADGVFTLYSTY